MSTTSLPLRPPSMSSLSFSCKKINFLWKIMNWTPLRDSYARPRILSYRTPHWNFKSFCQKNDMIWNHLATISPLYSCRSCPTLTSWVTKQPWPAPAIRLCRTFGGISQDLLWTFHLFSPPGDLVPNLIRNVQLLSRPFNSDLIWRGLTKTGQDQTDQNWSRRLCKKACK